MNEIKRPKRIFAEVPEDLFIRFSEACNGKAKSIILRELLETFCQEVEDGK